MSASPILLFTTVTSPFSYKNIEKQNKNTYNYCKIPLFIINEVIIVIMCLILNAYLKEFMCVNACYAMYSLICYDT